MRCVAVLLSVLSITGCAELFHGPRVVRYSDTEFYVRSIPVATSTETAESIPADLCGRVDRVPEVRDTYQFYWFDIEYTTYRCVKG